MNDVAIVTMASWGDVVISTLIVNALKTQKPDCRITYYTSSACAGAIKNNPHIDEQVIIQATKGQAWAVQDKIISDARNKHQVVVAAWAGYTPRYNWKPLDNNETSENFMWSYVRTAQSLGLNVPNPPLLYLYPTDDEKNRIAGYMQNVKSGTNILMEVKGESSQTYWNNDWTVKAIDKLHQIYNKPNVFISCGDKPDDFIFDLIDKYGIHYMNDYSLREMSVLFNYCDVFLGVSSGTSNACHGHLCKRNIKWIEAINDGVWDSKPLGYHNKVFFYGGDVKAYCNLLENILH